MQGKGTTIIKLLKYVVYRMLTLLNRVGRVVVYNIGVELSALLVSTDLVMRETLDHGTSIRTSSTLELSFVLYSVDK